MSGSASIPAGVVLAGLLLVPRAVSACSTCYGGTGDSPVLGGIRVAMLSLIGITGGVMVAIVSFFVYVHRRSKKLKSGQYVVSDQGVMFRLQRGLRKVEETR